MTGITHRTLLVAVGGVVALTAVGMALLWPGDLRVRDADDVEVVQTSRMLDGTLLDVTDVTDPDDEGLLAGARLVEVTARLDDPAETVTFDMVDDTGEMFQAGQRVRIEAIEQPDGSTTYLITDFRRGLPLTVLAVMFVSAVVGFSRWQGVRALLGLVLTFGIIIGFVLPAILDGAEPVLVALTGALAIMLVTLYLAHGYSRKTTAAVVGTACALVFTGVLASLFVVGASITGFTSAEARLANVELGGLSLRGLLLAGIILGGLGVLDDVTMSQSSTVFELHRANPRATFAQLLRSALNVGRDHIAATVNTLFLAYAGASLPLLILFLVGFESFGEILTAEVVAVEVVRTLVGSIGLIAAVPLTSALAAAVAIAEPAASAREAGHGHHHGPPDRPPRGSERERTRAAEADEETETWLARLRGAPPQSGDAPPDD